VLLRVTSDRLLQNRVGCNMPLWPEDAFLFERV
jgi:hypothetical protein